MNEELKKFYSEHREVTELSEAQSARVKEKVFARLGEAVQDEPPIVSLLEKLRRLFLHSYIVAPLVVILFVGGTAYASANSLPGDTLYPVKRGVENVRLFVAPTQDDKLQLQEEFAQKRLDEVAAVEAIDSPDSSEQQSQKNIKPDSQTKVEIDGKDVKSDNGEGQNQPEHQGQNRRNRQNQARHEANQALDQLNQTGENWSHRGNKEKAQEIQDKVNRFREQLKQHDGDHEGGNDFHSSGESLTPLLK